MQKGCAFATIAGLLFAVAPAYADPTVAECVDSFENAQRAHKNGHLVFARKLFQECVVAACPKEVRNDCTEGQASVERGIATVTFVVRDASGADQPSTIKIDGQPLAGDPGHAIPMDPGPHQVQYTVGGETKLSSVTIVEGEKSRVIVLTAGAAPPSSPPIVVHEPAPNNYLIAPAVVGGLGALTLLAGAGMFVLSSKEASQRDEQQAVFSDLAKTETERNNAARSANAHNDAAKNDRTIGIVLAGSALVMVGIAFTLYLVGRPEGKKAMRLSPVMTF